MTSDDFRSELTRLGLTQNRAGAFLKVDERTVRRWASGERDIPEAVAMLLPKLTPEECRKLLREQRSTR